jgi:hypothetical protein
VYKFTEYDVIIYDFSCKQFELLIWLLQIIRQKIAILGIN